MTGEEIVKGILEGCSLRTFMSPDPSLTSHPEHIESYDLPHVVIKGSHFWGKSIAGHLPEIPGQAPSGPNAFCYTNAVEFFCAHNPADGVIALMRKDRYKTHEWKLVRNHKLVWDSGGDQRTEAVAGEIEAGAKFRIAMLDSEGIWNVHPVDLPKYETESGLFQLTTAGESYPAFFRDLTYLFKLIPTMNDMRRETTRLCDASSFECFYSVFSDGSYYNFYDIQRNTKKDYQRLMVYSDIL